MLNEKELKQFIDDVLINTGELINRYFRQPLAIDLKQDDSPVTIADRECEQLIRKLIQQQYPDHNIYGEEFGFDNHHASEYCWVIDPIDGTRPFTCGMPLFGTLIALLKNEQPILGVIHQPFLQETWFAYHDKTYYNNQEIHTRKISHLKNALMTYMPHLDDMKILNVMQKVSDSVSHTALGGDCYTYGLLAKGHIDLIIEAQLKPHDYLPLVPIVKNAGGIITDWQGNNLTLESGPFVIAAASQDLHEKVLPILTL